MVTLSSISVFALVTALSFADAEEYLAISDVPYPSPRTADPAPTPALSTTTPASSTPHFETSEKKCCVCEYWHSPACYNQNQQNCETSEASHADCQWRDGSCKGRHHFDCIDWMNHPDQADCNPAPVVQRLRFPGDPTGGLKDCAPTEFHHRYEGHGLSCGTLADRVAICVDAFPTCSEFFFDDTGCSTFSDIDVGRRALADKISELGGEQCVTVSANQCTASNACQNRFVFTITSNGICGDSDTPCGGSCSEKDKNTSIVCEDENGTDKTQTCCCKTFLWSTTCTWQVGAAGCGGGGGSPNPKKPKANETMHMLRW